MRICWHFSCSWTFFLSRSPKHAPPRAHYGEAVSEFHVSLRPHLHSHVPPLLSRSPTSVLIRCLAVNINEEGTAGSFLTELLPASLRQARGERRERETRSEWLEVDPSAQDAPTELHNRSSKGTPEKQKPSELRQPTLQVDFILTSTASCALEELGFFFFSCIQIYIFCYLWKHASVHSSATSVSGGLVRPECRR